jgi:hypothetical protein
LVSLDLLPSQLVNNLSCGDIRLKYSAAKNLISLSKNEPAALIPHFDFLIKLLDSSNNILKWTAIDILGFMSCVILNHKAEELFQLLQKLKNGGRLITTNHSLSAMGHIGLNHHQMRAKVISELCNASALAMESPECKQIAVGKAIDILYWFKDDLSENQQVKDLILWAEKSNRNATVKKVHRLKKLLVKKN